MTTTSCQLPMTCLDILLKADGKTLASYSEESGVHVVPVSSIKVVDDQIILVNYFMGQTLRNITENPSVSLACWKGLEGYQIKAIAEYQTSGEHFDEVVAWIAETIPSRVVKGILVLTPITIFDVSADTNRAGTPVLS